MSRASVQRRLAELSDQLKALRRELAVVDEQLLQLVGEADDARLRALVSETPLAERDHREAERHAAAMARHRDALARQLEAAERGQDELLDKLIAYDRRP